MENKVKAFIDKKEKENALRELRPVSRRAGAVITVGGKEYIDLSSNNYLGLAGHPKMAEASRLAALNYGTGSGASRLLSGDTDLFHELEDRTAAFKKKEAALVFNSGYQANVGIISSLFGSGDAIFADRLVHASIVDGAALSGARLFRFRHNDPEHLRALLKKDRQKFCNALIVTESVFSMDGDIAPLKELADLKEEYKCVYMADEAHATGIYGSQGGGLVDEEGLSGRVDLLMGTFSKAMGSFGAYVGCTKKLKQYLVNTGRSFIFSTALPPTVVASSIRALELVKKSPDRRARLKDISHYFRDLLKKAGIRSKSQSQIVPVVAGENDAAVRLSERMLAAGFWVLPIRHPTVPKGQARLRFSLTCDHDKAMADRIVEVLKKK